MKNNRILTMVESFKKEGRAWSNIVNDDSEFFKLAGIDSFSTGVTSQTGNDLLYYDTSVFISDDNAIKNIK